MSHNQHSVRTADIHSQFGVMGANMREAEGRSARLGKGARRERAEMSREHRQLELSTGAHSSPRE